MRLQRISKRFLFVQSALLYSSSDGQRRIRCHNIAVPLTQNVSEAYNFLDINTTAHLLMRKAISRFDKVPNIEQARSIVETYVKNMSQVHSRCNKGEHSENMQYFYMYALGVLKSSVIDPPQIMNPIDTVDKVCY